MTLNSYDEKAELYLKALCGVKPNRRTASSGNRQATDFFAKIIRPYVSTIDATPFEALDYFCDGTILAKGEETFEVYASPYSVGCDLSAVMVTVSSVEELERTACEGKILLMKGAICSEQLMPKNFVFYNPEHHQKIISLLESLKPGGIIAATKKNPEMVGALDPFPLFVDGDFDIPNVYCRDTEGEEIAAHSCVLTRLRIDAKRIPSSSSNVLARLNSGKNRKIVITAHIDAYESTPGASDNASGIVVLLLAAEMLAEYRGEHTLEIVALNGEDHYSVAGQMDYLKRYGNELPTVSIAINIDDVGFKQGKSSYSFYECKPDFEEKVEDVFRKFEGLNRGEEWFNGDHMIFVQNQVPAIAITSELTPELMKTVTHTFADTPDLIDYRKLVEVAMALNEVVRAF